MLSTTPFIQTKAQKLFVAGLTSVLLLGASTASADEADAKRLLKAMSDYVGAQKSISFEYDATLEVITSEGQVLGIASSGALHLSRPNKIHATRSGGFADAGLMFDGKTLTVLGKNLNVYSQVEIPGNIDNLINELKDTYNRPLPGADLLLADSYTILMENVTDVKDLGSGVIDGVECDSLAFRSDEVDWQIWIAQGDQPYPCRYTITSKLIENGPQYSVQTKNWAASSTASEGDFSFKNTTDAKKVELEDIRGLGGLPEIFVVEQGESE